MYRYISLIWNEHDGRATETAAFLTAHFMGTETDWIEVYAGAGLRVLHTGEEKGRMQAYPLNTREQDSGGVVLGKLFDRPSDPEAIPGNAELDVGEARRVITSAGRRLIDDYWGSWVAFFQCGNKKYVLVDPIGTFCCFSTHYRGVEIYFTYMPDVADCEFLSFSIDWLPIARNIRFPFDKTEAGLREVTKVPSGQCLAISPSMTEKAFHWDPQKISQTDLIENINEAEAALRRVLLITVAALAAPYDRILHQIGGLDSSIVLACLKEVPTSPEVTCINVFHDSPMGDERYYVRQAAGHLDIPLVEHLESTANLNFQAMLETPQVAFPYFHAQHVGLERDILQIARDRNAQAIFGGRGGDEILYTTRSSYGAIDYVKSHGLRPPLARLIMEAARIQNRSVWSILPKILQDGYRNRQWDFYRETNVGTVTLLNDEVEALVQPDGRIHPWIRQSCDVKPGKLDQIVSYTMGTYAQECKVSPNEHITAIEPMLSQPVIELCLRIPSWVMTTDGKTRGLARKAFRDKLPDSVIWRESKMAFNSYSAAIFRENREILKSVLLDGVLVSDKIVDSDRLAKILKMDHDSGERDAMSLKILLDAEIWARKWRGHGLKPINKVDMAA